MYAIRSYYGHVDLHLNVLVAAPFALFDSLPRDAEPCSRLRAGRNPQGHLLPIDRLHPDLRAQQRLREVDRNRAVYVQPVTAEERVTLDLEGDDEVAGGRARFSFFSSYNFV